MTLTADIARHRGTPFPTPRCWAISLLALILSVTAGCARVAREDVQARRAAAQPACPRVDLHKSNRFTAEPFDSGLPRTGQWRDGFDLADMNGDGTLDLLHGPARKGAMQPSIFLGDGRGQFRRWEHVHFPPLAYDYGDVKAADLNGDGRADIALAAHLRGLTVLINEAGGHYAPWSEGLLLRLPAESVNEPVFTSRRIALADWNGDGTPDLLAANEGPSRIGAGAVPDAFGLWFNRGGVWDRAVPEQAVQGFSDAIAAGDIDGDGDLDALLGSQVIGNRLLLQIGDQNLFRARELRSLPRDAAVTAVALHDMDADARADALVATRAADRGRFCTALYAVRDAGSAKERPLALWGEASNDALAALAFADIDGDGHDDLVALREQGEILLFAGTGRGFSRDLRLAPIEALSHCSVFDAQLADLDGDGGPELIVSYAGDETGTGSGSCAGGGGFAAWHLRGGR